MLRLGVVSSLSLDDTACYSCELHLAEMSRGQGGLALEEHVIRILRDSDPDNLIK